MSSKRFVLKRLITLRALQGNFHPKNKMEKKANPGHISFSKHSLRAQGPALNPPGGRRNFFLVEIPWKMKISKDQEEEIRISKQIFPATAGAGSLWMAMELELLWNRNYYSWWKFSLLPAAFSWLCSLPNYTEHTNHCKKHFGLPPYLTHPQQAAK